MSETLQPGPEMDALVCEAVGIPYRTEWWGVTEDGGIAMTDEFRTSLESRLDYYRREMPTSWIARCTVKEARIYPPVSRELAFACQILATLGLSLVRSEDGWYAVKPEDIEHGTVRGTAFPTITLVWPEHATPTPAETPALAICRAALAACPPPRPEDAP